MFIKVGDHFLNDEKIIRMEQDTLCRTLIVVLSELTSTGKNKTLIYFLYGPEAQALLWWANGLSMDVVDSYRQVQEQEADGQRWGHLLPINRPGSTEAKIYDVLARQGRLTCKELEIHGGNIGIKVSRIAGFLSSLVVKGLVKGIKEDGSIYYEAIPQEELAV